MNPGIINPGGPIIITGWNKGKTHPVFPKAGYTIKIAFIEIFIKLCFKINPYYFGTFTITIIN